MIRSAHLLSRPEKIAHASRATPSDRATPYGTPFWMTCAATTLMMMAISLLFRYADFVTLLGGNEFHLGWIVGVGMVGSLAARLVIGTGIDRYGARAVWLGSLALLAASCFAHLWVTTCHGPMIYLLRTAFCCAIAGFFGSSVTFISSRVSTVRIAEMVGMVGTSGFVGMVLGTQLGDLLLGTETIRRGQVNQMFVVAGLLGIAAMVFVYLATRGQSPPVPAEHVPLWDVLRRYHPGTVLLVGVATGVGLGLPGTFLRTFAAEMGIVRIGLFFAAYAPTAIITRLLTRRLPERLGTTPMILTGMGALVISQLLFLPVSSQWHLILPGIGYGLTHAVLFPSVIAAGSRTFPRGHRGLASTLILGTYDMGQLFGAPLAGAIVCYSRPLGLPGYPTMFISMALLLASIGVLYALTNPRRKAADKRLADVREARDVPQGAEPTVAASSCGDEKL